MIGLITFKIIIIEFMENKDIVKIVLKVLSYIITLVLGALGQAQASVF